MAIFDIVILVVICLSAIIGWARGLVKELMSLVSWVAALVLSYIFKEQAAQLIESFLPIEQPLSLVVGFIAIFVILLLVASLISYLMSSIIETIGLKGLDRVFGAVFGVARGVVIIAMAILLSINVGLNTKSWYVESEFVDNIEPIAHQLYQLLPNNITDYFSKDESESEQATAPTELFKNLQELKQLNELQNLSPSDDELQQSL